MILPEAPVTQAHRWPQSPRTLPQGQLGLASSSTKLRVVFDASEKTSPSNVTLNQALLVGATVQNDVFVMLVRFRKHFVMFTANMSQMYRQIRVAVEYWRSQLQQKSSDMIAMSRTSDLIYSSRNHWVPDPDHRGMKIRWIPCPYLEHQISTFLKLFVRSWWISVTAMRESC